MHKLYRKTATEACEYPVRIIQFGEGNFLRGFADWMVYMMNKKIGFNTGIVVVQPLPQGKVDELNKQDGLYHLNLQGIQNGETVDRIELIDVLTHGINPYLQFQEYLQLAENPEIRFVFSNTTEAGIEFNPNCQFQDKPANSYPGKLTQLLYHRFLTFQGSMEKGWIIFPCELIFHNGTELKKCIHQYIELWELGDEFRNWVEHACGIYSTLVDRIVPGYPTGSMEEVRKRVPFDDSLMVAAEIFHLWIIEAPESVEKEFPASEAGLNVRFVSNEKPYHERKVTLLNGPHTVLSPVGYLSGLNTVRECMENEVLGKYIHQVMFNELMGTLDLPETELTEFAESVLDRFRNPYLNHLLTSIMLNSFSKFKTRDLPGLKKFLRQKGSLPKGLVLGLAGIIYYYRGGTRGQDEIVLQDDQSVLSRLTEYWNTNEPQKVAQKVLGDTYLWDEDLNLIPGLTEQVFQYLESIQNRGMGETVKTIL